MKQCANCLEQNTDGATNCVICGEGLPVAQVNPLDEPLPAPILEAETKEAAPIEIVPLVESPAPEPVAELTKKAQDSFLLIRTDGADTASPPECVGELFPGWIKAAIEVYHDSEAKVVHTHVIVNDITLIGREDPQRDVFPDIDLAKLEGVSAGHASREHLRILRQGDKFFLYIYRGSTGTQVNKEIIEEARYGKKFEIQIGDRIILGGKVRLKLIKQ